MYRRWKVIRQCANNSVKFYEIKTDQRENEKLMEVSTESMNSRSTKKTSYIKVH